MHALHSAVTRTRSGLYARYDKDVGLFVFSPFTGLFFGVHDNDVPMVLDWLQGKSNYIPDRYGRVLGTGWFCDESVGGQSDQLLPDLASWGAMTFPSRPLLVNWLITGQCTHDCVYCYAKDEMHEHSIEPGMDDLRAVADQIIALQPLAVVLSGGEPLLSPHLFEIIDYISDRVGVFVDSNGYLLEQRHIDYFKSRGVVLRLSIDSLRPSSNCRVRPLRGQHQDGAPLLNRIVRGLSMCLDSGLTTVVHTVLTRENMNELVDMGERLLNVGLKVWRIMVLDDTPLSDEVRKKLWYEDEAARDKAYRHVYSELAKKNWYDMKVLIRRTPKVDANNVILVNTKGEFKKQSSIRGMGKVFIDSANPFSPQLGAGRTNFEWVPHYDRYLNFSR